MNPSLRFLSFAFAGVFALFGVNVALALLGPSLREALNALMNVILAWARAAGLL